MERSLFGIKEAYTYWPIPTIQLTPQTSCKESVVSPLFNRPYSFIVNKDSLYKENARRKQVLKENEYQGSIVSKIFTLVSGINEVGENFAWNK